MYERILETKGIKKGEVRKIMPDIGFGAIWDKKNKQDVFFSTLTKFINTSYEKLNEGDEVEVLVVKTPRGLFAKNLFLRKT